MDLRREPRFEADTPVWLTVLADGEKPFQASITNFSGNGLGLEAARAVSPGAAVQVEGRDVLLLGEVAYCRPQAGGFALGLEIEHVLYRACELEPLVTAEAEEHF